MVDLFIQALKKAGKNPTTDKLYDAFLTIKNAPAAYESNGEGGFSKIKTYFANQVHLETLNQANTSTPKDANGLYNGCPAPVACWVPQLIDGTRVVPRAVLDLIVSEGASVRLVERGLLTHVCAGVGLRLPVHGFDPARLCPPRRHRMV